METSRQELRIRVHFHSRFSKYCGVTEWRNAIYLWVNIGGSDYSNQFQQNERRMTWFAGNRHTDESREIKRIIKMAQSTAKMVASKSKGNGKAKGKKKDCDDDQQAVLLFCRLPKVLLRRVLSLLLIQIQQSHRIDGVELRKIV